jgi:hypothetical protein
MVDCSGKPFIRAPKWTALVGYQHVFALADSAQIVAGANVKFASASYIATDYIPSERQADYALVDLNLGYKSAKRHWSGLCPGWWCSSTVAKLAGRAPPTSAVAAGQLRGWSSEIFG